VLRCARRFRGDVGEVASDDRNVCAAGDSAGFESNVGRKAFRPGSSAGSRGKRRCRVRDPVAIDQLSYSHDSCSNPGIAEVSGGDIPLVPAIIARAAEASLNIPSIAFHSA